MTAKTELSAPKRRTRAEVQQLVAEFVSSGMRRSEFCQSRGLSFSTLDRHLKKLRWKRRRKPISSPGHLVPVELAARKSPKQKRRTLCVPWLLVERTGCTSAAHKRDRRLRRFSRSWKAAVGCKSG